MQLCALSLSLALLLQADSSHALNVRPGAGTSNGNRRVHSSSSSTSKNAIAMPMPDGTIMADTPNPARFASLSPEDQWIANMDYHGFRKEISALGKELIKDTGDADVDHLMKIVEWRNIAAILGLATIWASPNPLTIAALSTWTYASWTMIAHHTCHGGYNRVEAGRYNSRGFALGFTNRVIDWLDWMQPEAWNVEHNRLHHYRLNEGNDPDLVQRNLEFLREKQIPVLAKYATVFVLMPIWKWYYYSANTFKELKISEFKNQGKELPAGLDPEEAVTIVGMLNPNKSALHEVAPPLEFFTQILGPMMVCRYLLIPALFLAIPGPWGATLATHALINLVVADLLSNVHAFTTIVTNHCGEDMYTFDDAVRPRSGAFYVRQIIGSANYAYGTDRLDFAHGWLNYQIEHHVWPDLSMLQYQKAAPQLKSICEKYGVPYVQESVFERLRKTVDVMVGRTTMRKFPTEYEPTNDKVTTVTWKSTNGAIEDDGH